MGRNKKLHIWRKRIINSNKLPGFSHPSLPLQLLQITALVAALSSSSLFVPHVLSTFLSFRFILEDFFFVFLA